MMLSLSSIANLLSCPLSETDLSVTGMAIDSREVKAGYLFVALKGEQVDGHDYLDQAYRAGASAALVSQLQDNVALPQLIVSDVVRAFGQIAHYWRLNSSAKIVAITGSNGKTTVKEMVAAILSYAGKSCATQGNLNNQLGVPLSLSSIKSDTEYAAIEMGTNYPGEIAELVSIVAPDVAVITNIAEAHLARLGDLDGVAEEKSAIYRGLPENACAVINNDLSYAKQWRQSLNDRKCLSFALENEADITADDIQLGETSSHFMASVDGVLHYIQLPLPGKHNIANALAAIAATTALSIPMETIVKGLNNISSVPHRLQLRRGPNGAQLIDDSYNANPASYQQALSALQHFASPYWLVLGDFGELGPNSEQIHIQLGRDAKAAKVEKLFTIGEQSRLASNEFGTGAQHFDDLTRLQQHLQRNITQDVTCLIKGSHFMRLADLADALTTEEISQC